MSEKYEKKQTYEFCELRNLMVRLDVIQVTIRMPDFAHAEIKLVPKGCNAAKECQKRGLKCIVFDPNGLDPCPDAWEGAL